MASYALSEREAGSDAAAMRTRATADGDGWGAQQLKMLDSNGGRSTWYAVMAATDLERGSRYLRAMGFTRMILVLVSARTNANGLKGSPTTELYFENCRVPGHRIIGDVGTGFGTALVTLDHTRPTIGAQAVGIAQGALEAALGLCQGARQFGQRVADFQARNSCSPTWQCRSRRRACWSTRRPPAQDRDEQPLSFSSSAADVSPRT